jgi:hypothetical protein
MTQVRFVGRYQRVGIICSFHLEDIESEDKVCWLVFYQFTRSYNP